MTDPRDIPRIKTGRCCVCGEPVYEVDRIFPDSAHPYGGEPQMVCLPRDGTGVEIVTLILSDGTQMDQPLCHLCEITPENLPLIWKKNLQGWFYECANRAAIGANALTRVQQSQQIGHLTDKTQVVPLGILHRELRTKNDRYYARIGR